MAGGMIYPDKEFVEDPDLEVELGMTDEEIVFHRQQLERGDLAYTPMEMDCWECGGHDGVTSFKRKVTKLGPVVNEADPTQTYELECGHLGM